MSRIKRYSYNFSHRTLTEGGLFSLTPFSIIHVNPGETLTGHIGQFCRVLPLRAPLFNRFYLHHWWFYVPYSCISNDWEEFAKKSIWGDNSMTYPPDLIPKDADNYKGPSWLFLNGDSTSNYITLKAYNKIWNIFFRDPQYHDPVDDNYQWTGKFKTDELCYFRRGYVSFLKDFESTLMPKDIMATEVQFPVQYENTTAPAGKQNYIELEPGQPVGNVEIPETDNAGVAAYLGLNQELSNSVTEGLVHDQSSTKLRLNVPPSDLQVKLDALSVQCMSEKDLQLKILATFQAANFKFTERDFREAFDYARQQMAKQWWGERDYYDAMKSIGSKLSREQEKMPEMLMQSHRLLPMTDTMPSGDKSTGEVGGYILSSKRDRFPRKIFKEHGVVMGLMAIRPEIFNPGFVDMAERMVSNKGSSVPNGQLFSERFWFGKTEPESWEPFTYTYEPATGECTAAECTNGWMMAHDNIRRPFNKTNASIYNANKPIKEDTYGSWDQFMLTQYGSTDAKAYRLPTYMNSTRLNNIFNPQAGLTIDGDTTKFTWVSDTIGSHYLVKSDIMLKKISPVMPTSKVVFRRTT